MDWEKEIKETALYLVAGLLLAYIINLGLGYALHADKPVMAVVSKSMEPTFYKGDIVVIKGVDPSEVKVGDIIVYYNPYRNFPVVHRVVEIKREGSSFCFITKGDNNRTNPFPDQFMGIAPCVTPDMVKGKVIYVIPKLGWPRVMLNELFH